MRRKMIVMLAAVLAMLSAMSISAVSQAEVIHETDLEDYILQELSDAHILGMSISIVNSEKELYCAGYGMAQETDMDYALGDLTKSLTAAGILRMAEDSDISLEDTVDTYLSSYSGFGDITVRELLNQTSGIAQNQDSGSVEPEGERGTFEDANLNYIILGDIISAVSGMQYEEYISDNLFDALEMTSTYSMRHDAELAENMITGYRTYFGFPFRYQYQYSENDTWMGVSSSYMISDVKDMGKYLQMYLQEGGTLLSKKSIRKMLSGNITIPEGDAIASDMFGGEAAYGMGWLVKEVNGEKLYYCSGKTESYMTAMVLLPESDLGIVMMFNSADTLAGEKMVQTIEEGIVQIEMGKTPATVSANTYLLRHVFYDILLLLMLLFVWFPVFMVGKWYKQQKQKPLSVPILIADVLMHLILPSVLLLLMVYDILPAVRMAKFLPDVYWVIWAAIFSLYLGAVIKITAFVALRLHWNQGEDLEMQKTQSEVEETVAEEAAGETKPEETVAEKETAESKPEETAAKKETVESKPEEMVAEKEIAAAKPAKAAGGETAEDSDV